MLKYARGFCILAEELHFGRTAARLHVTQPALSHQLKAMEQEVGCSLVRRSPHHVELTEAGAGLARELGVALSQIDRAVETARDVARGDAGALVIAYCELPRSGNFALVMQAYTALYPAVVITLRTVPTNAQVAGLLNGSIDIGFLHPPLPPSDLVLRAAGQESLVAVMQPTHDLAAYPMLRLAQLAPERLIVCTAQSAPNLHAALHAACARAGFVPSLRVAEDSWHSMAAQAEAGLGVALIPESLAARIGPHIVFRPVADIDWRLETAIATAAGPRRPAVDRFLAVAEAVALENRPAEP